MIGFFCLALALVLAGPVASASGSDAVVGTWYVESDKGDVHITITGTGGEYRGAITWMEEPEYPADHPRAGQPKTDTENPEEELRDRPILGLELMYGFRWDEADREWKDGRIYAADSGKTYRCKLKLEEDGRLKVRGYVKVGFVKLGRSMHWTRVEPDDEESTP